MSSSLRARLVAFALTLGMGLIVAVPSAQASLEVEHFYSLTCNENEPEGEPLECNPETKEEFYTQAGGHPNFGITDLTPSFAGELENNGLKSIRTDLPPGFATNPQALAECSPEVFKKNLFTPKENECPGASQAGLQEATLVFKSGPEELVGKVYDLTPSPFRRSADCTCTRSSKAA